MQILLNTDPHTDGSHEMASHLQATITDALGRFSGQITRVEAHLSDANSHAKSGPADIHCTLEARLAGHEPVVVKDHAGTAHQAIHAAVNKLKRAVITALSKQDPRRSTGLPDQSDPEATDDSPR